MMVAIPKSINSPAVNDNVAKPKKPRFEIVRFDDANQSISKEHVVQRLIGAGEFSLWVAKPGTAKSVLLCDIGCHVAAGMDWHGRKVKKGVVVFFAAERKLLTERRIAGWGKKHKVSGIPFVIVSGKLDLTTGLFDAKDLAKSIALLAAEYSLPCRLVIIDTVTRTFGPGDQNNSRDMQRFIQSVDELISASGAHVAAIHHSGWAGDRGKGAIDLDGAIDVSYGVGVIGSGEYKVFKLECTGANDGDEGVITSFKLESVDLGTDADGNITAAPVVVQVDGAKQDGSNLKGNTAKALDSLKRAIEEHGLFAPEGSPGIPERVATVTRDQWRERYLDDVKVKEPDIKENTFRQRFTRSSNELTAAEMVGATGERCWIE